ncbi:MULTISPECIES: hypothetical protein [Micromonospora]|uniref:Uncharacterized protein n=1 Tax=Micromonospora yangpuensis TaxID=683228 RepID=A0A1C6V2U4_9ACTN|nr:hypothetical protein [Micromonospora yangpuensis]GGM14586.1 hypothetical protein GCM10012279_35850 [Micromonospora yangpuensis]SCL60616.1 hypothetical protein GA0070617_4430 [Micromonospora yangpuensis]
MTTYAEFKAGLCPVTDDLWIALTEPDRHTVREWLRIVGVNPPSNGGVSPGQLKDFERSHRIPVGTYRMERNSNGTVVGLILTPRENYREFLLDLTALRAAAGESAAALIPRSINHHAVHEWLRATYPDGNYPHASRINIEHLRDFEKQNGIPLGVYELHRTPPNPHVDGVVVSAYGRFLETGSFDHRVVNEWLKVAYPERRPPSPSRLKEEHLRDFEANNGITPGTYEFSYQENRNVDGVVFSAYGTFLSIGVIDHHAVHGWLKATQPGVKHPKESKITDGHLRDFEAWHDTPAGTWRLERDERGLVVGVVPAVPGPGDAAGVAAVAALSSPGTSYQLPPQYQAPSQFHGGPSGSRPSGRGQG